MPVPSSITDLSQTAGSNYPSGGESPITTDDYLRSHASFIAMLRDGKGFANPVTLASAATTDIGAQNSQFVEISGTTTITSLGSTYNGPRFLRFTGALTLTHNATTLNIQGSSSIVTAAGDTGIAIPNVSLNGWNIVLYNRAAGFAASGANNDITSLGALTSIQSATVRQTVLSGPVDANGFPTFLPATSVNLNLTSQNVSTGVNALVATASGGVNASGVINAVGQATANLTWTGCTANQKNYLPVSIAAGVLTALTPVILAPIYQKGGTPSVTAGQYTYNKAQKIMWLGNGATATAVNHVIVGEAVAGASTITSTIAYMYEGEYDSGYTATLPGSGVPITKNSNLGVEPGWFDLILKCTTADNGFSVGDTVHILSTGATVYAQSIWSTANTVGFTSANSGTTSVSIPNKSTGIPAYLVAANWSYKVTAGRGMGW